MLTSPACNTFSRAVWSDEVSPHPLRDCNHPWGFPWLGRKDREKCEQANAMVTFSLAVLEAALAANHRGLDVGAAMEHPEDLGQTVRGRPASIWQLPRTRALAKGGFFTFAFYQCSFGAELAKPTRLLTNIPGLQGGWKAGWPSFDGTGWYLGPLQLPCGHHHPAVADGSPAGFARLARSAAYPSDMNAWLAKHFMLHFTSSHLLPSDGPRFSGEISELCSRMPLEQAGDPESWPPSYIYIGRGVRSRGIPQSEWCNHFRVSQYGREEAVAMFKRRIKADDAMMNKIHELKGKTLICHCRPEELCHGDSLKEILADLTLQSDQSPKEGLDIDEGNEGPPHRGGEGPRGIGPPLMTWKKGQPRELADGGGLCSPGKWPLNRRRYENGEASSELRAVILKALDSLGDVSAQRRLVFELAAGRFGVSPFPEEMVSGVRRDWAAMLAARGHPRSPSPVDMPQSIDMRLLEALAAAAGDPDAGVASQAAKGVRTGILSTLPRTPAIFEAKSKWPLPDESDRSWSGERSRDNYISAAERPDVLRRQFDEEVEQGMMENCLLPRPAGAGVSIWYSLHWER